MLTLIPNSGTISFSNLRTKLLYVSDMQCVSILWNALASSELLYVYKGYHTFSEQQLSGLKLPAKASSGQLSSFQEQGHWFSKCPPTQYVHPVWKDHFSIRCKFPSLLESMQTESIWEDHLPRKTIFSSHCGWSFQTGFTVQQLLPMVNEGIHEYHVFLCYT